MTTRHTLVALATTLALATAGPAWAQAASYRPGSVWTFSHIETLPGQGERYLDFLASQWKKLHEYGKQQGHVLSYRVLQVNHPRQGEPDLILAVEYPDYLNNAQRLELQKKIDAFLANDSRSREVEAGKREAMRKQLGSMELQELILK